LDGCWRKGRPGRERAYFTGTGLNGFAWGNTDGDLENIRVEGMRVTDLETQRSFDITADITIDATGLGSMLRTGLTGAPVINSPYKIPISHMHAVPSEGSIPGEARVMTLWIITGTARTKGISGHTSIMTIQSMWAAGSAKSPAGLIR
jgi:hypothetical protein